MPDINLKLQIDKNDLKKKLDVRDGHTPTPEELTELIKPLIPEPIRGGRGEKGVKGDKGDSIQGPKGEKGEVGIGIVGPQGIPGLDGKNGRDGIDKEPETGDSIIEKIDPLKNKLNFQILKNVPDFVLFKDLPSRGGDQGGGGGSIVTYRDSTAARISAYITDLQFGSGLSTSYSNGKITLTSTGLGGTVTSVASADGSITVTNPTTTPDLSVVQAPKLTTARTISITGDLAYTSGSFDGSGNVTGTGTLASIISAGGPTGSATVAPIITYDAKGRLTAVSSATITPAASSITGGAALTKTDDTNVTLTLGGSPSTALLAATSLTLGWTGTLADSRLSTTAVSANSYGSATQVGTFTVSATGRLTAAANVTVTPAVVSITGLGTGVATWLATPSSANLASALTDKTGTGINVFGTAPTFTTSITLSTANIITDTTTGTKFGTATNQKISFYNSTPIIQPTGDVITGLQNLGLMASATITATTNANLTGPITSLGNATSIASQTGTGTKFVVDTSPTIITPTFTTSATGPLYIGGSGTTQTLILKTTTGVGVAGADMIFQVGNNGATEAMRILNSGNIGFGTTAPGYPLHIKGNGTLFFIEASLGVGADVFESMGVDPTNGPAFNFGYSGNSFGRGSGFFNVRPDASATGVNPSLRFLTSNTVAVVITNVQNTKFGGSTAVRGTTEGTNHIDIFDGTAPVGTLTNGISLYSTSGELRCMDASGNATLLSPHSKIDNAWIYFSKNTVTGKVLRIDMEKMLKFLNKHFGTDFIQEYTEPI